MKSAKHDRPRFQSAESVNWFNWIVAFAHHNTVLRISNLSADPFDETLTTERHSSMVFNKHCLFVSGLRNLDSWNHSRKCHSFNWKYCHTFHWSLMKKYLKSKKLLTLKILYKPFHSKFDRERSKSEFLAFHRKLLDEKPFHWKLSVHTFRIFSPTRLKDHPNNFETNLLSHFKNSKQISDANWISHVLCSFPNVSGQVLNRHIC